MRGYWRNCRTRPALVPRSMGKCSPTRGRRPSRLWHGGVLRRGVRQGKWKLARRELQQERDQVKSALDAVNKRLPQVLRTCKCGRDPTGEDLLIRGYPACKLGLTAALVGSNDNGPTVTRAELTPLRSWLIHFFIEKKILKHRLSSWPLGCCPGGRTPPVQTAALKYYQHSQSAGAML